MISSERFLEAKALEPSLTGFSWPNVLDLDQLAKIHFPDSGQNRQEISALLDGELNSNRLEFSHIRAIGGVTEGLVTSPYKTGSGLYAAIHNALSPSEESVLAAHEPVNGWAKLLSGLRKDETTPLLGHPHGCAAECTLIEIFDNGLPSRWKTVAHHADGNQYAMPYRAMPMLTPGQYRQFCDRNHVPIQNTALVEWLAHDEAGNGEELSGKPSCGTWYIHELIDRAFYRVAETKPIADIKPSDVMSAIRDERNVGGKRIDEENIIKSITPDNKNGGHQIVWKSHDKKSDKPFTYRAFSDCVRLLRKANIAE